MNYFKRKKISWPNHIHYKPKQTNNLNKHHTVLNSSKYLIKLLIVIYITNKWVLHEQYVIIPLTPSVNFKWIYVHAIRLVNQKNVLNFNWVFVLTCCNGSYTKQHFILIKNINVSILILFKYNFKICPVIRILNYISLVNCKNL